MGHGLVAELWGYIQSEARSPEARRERVRGERQPPTTLGVVGTEPSRGRPVGTSELLPLSSEEFDRHLVSHDFVGNPYATLRRMQREAPIYWSDSVGGWLITRYDDIMSTFKATKDYSNEGRLGRAAAHLSSTDRQRLLVFEEHFATKDFSTPTRPTTPAFANLRRAPSPLAGSRISGRTLLRSRSRCWTSVLSRAGWTLSMT